MKAFLAAPFTRELRRTTGRVRPVYRKRLEMIINCIRDLGLEVASAHLREDWGKHLLHPEKFVPLDFQEIKDCDIFIGYVSDKPSGTLVEIGWASDLKKRIVILSERRVKLSPMIDGLHTIADTVIIRFASEKELLKGLREALKKITNGSATIHFSNASKDQSLES